MPQPQQCQILNLLCHQRTSKRPAFYYASRSCCIWLQHTHVYTFLKKKSEVCVGRYSFFFFFFFFFFFVFIGPHLRHMEVPRLGVQSELLLPACARDTAMPDPSHVFDLAHSSWQRWILNQLSKARDRTGNLMVPSQIHFHCATTGTPKRYSTF